jgi:hypothetical protein
MAEQKENSKTVGYFLIVIGVIGIATRFIGGMNLTTVGIIKLVFSIGVLSYGLWVVLKKNK